jgi:molybdopterin synthase sulfur carrier subunit
MAIVTLRYWAAAKEAAGAAEEKVKASTLAEALAAGLAASDQSGQLSRVLDRSSFLVNGEPAGKRPPESITLAEDSVVEILPPFAGG